MLIILSAFFSSAETSLISLDKIKLNHIADKKNKKAILLREFLKNPGEFFSTILIGNNLVNIAAASLSTILITELVVKNKNLILLYSTLFTTAIILFFAEIIPKTYAFRYSEKVSFFYAYPIKFFEYLFYPFVKIISLLSSLFFRRKSKEIMKKEFSVAEIKYFLESEIQLFKYNPETLRMINEIIDIAQKDIKSIMTPRLSIISLEENSNIEKLKKIILEKRISKIPIYRGNLDCITGIINSNDMLSFLMEDNLENLDLKKISREPIFVSEYSSINYVLKEFKKHKLNIAVILDEYGATIGILTLSDILKEVLGEVEISRKPIKEVNKNTFLIKGDITVDEVNNQFGLALPEKKDYTTMSGMFVFFYGRLPKINSKIKLENNILMVENMAERRIEEIRLIINEKSVKHGKKKKYNS
jgi:CBS domain containing-hemolysin-like protein